ncbi:hypothetical protein, partial [uncultured Pseudoflavonifractor sp.]|uniref:hypothetical protein n=1 Tax=uncultured Pseudoflavonifractor sp. TaxID=1221379 RepID=UPI002600445C
QLHKAGEGAGFDTIHEKNSFLMEIGRCCRAAAGAASSVLRSKTLKLTGFTPGNLSQIRGPGESGIRWG